MAPEKTASPTASLPYSGNCIHFGEGGIVHAKRSDKLGVSAQFRQNAMLWGSWAAWNPSGRCRFRLFRAMAGDRYFTPSTLSIAAFFCADPLDEPTQ